MILKIVKLNDERPLNDGKGMYVVYTLEISIPDMHLGLKWTVPDCERASLQGLNLYYGKKLRFIWFQWHVSLLDRCLHFRGLDLRGPAVCPNPGQNVYVGHNGACMYVCGFKSSSDVRSICYSF